MQTPFSLPNSVHLRASVHHEKAPAVEGLFTKLQQLRTKKKALEKQPVVYAGVFRKPDPTFLLRRGDPEQPLDAVVPAIPKVLGDVSLSTTESEQQRRRSLAEWIASPENPLTARVMVNRIWQHHFGNGMVPTSSDFGLNGQPPSHPDLLDWLAREFTRNRWSIKHIHRLVVTSRTYQQTSRIRPGFGERDDRWLWRFPSRRIEAEAVRDSILSVSGELNLKMGGPGFNFFKSRGGLNGFPPIVQFEKDGLRRMVYAHKVRMEKTPVFGAFDCPDAGQPMPRRSQSTTAIQALNLFNSGFVMERAQSFAARVQNEHPDDLQAQVERAFQLALGRFPKPIELAQAIQLCSDHGLDSLCRALFNTNEFLFLQ